MNHNVLFLFFCLQLNRFNFLCLPLVKRELEAEAAALAEKETAATAEVCHCVSNSNIFVPVHL